MFESVNEIAVLGTTFLMMAVATIWYSPMAFGTLWEREARITDHDIQKMKHFVWSQIAATFVSYFLMLFLLAHVVSFSPFVHLSVLKLAVLISIFVAALSIGPVIWEGKSLKYYGISVGFFTVFIIVGSLTINYWPW